MDTSTHAAPGPLRVSRRAAALFAFFIAAITVAAPQSHAAADGRLVNGTAVNASEVATNGRWSSVVSIVTIAGNQSRLCTGTLIRPNWVATAAHCLGHPANPTQPVAADDVIVTAGSTAINAEDHSPATVSVAIHPGYNATTAAWDVALIELAENQTHNVMALPEPAAAGSYEFGTTDNVVGFGRTNGLDGGSSGTLHSGRLEPLSPDECATYRPGSGPHADCLVPGNTRQMACFGDSGGPVVRFDPARGGAPVLWGVTSIGPSQCQTTPVVPTYHTRIASVREWIDVTIATSDFTPTNRPVGPGPGATVSAKTPLGGAGIGVFETRVQRQPTRARSGKVRLTASYVGGMATGRVQVERCRGRRCSTTTNRTVKFAGGDDPQRTTIALPRCTPGTTIHLRLHVKSSSNSAQDRATKRIARCR